MKRAQAASVFTRPEWAHAIGPNAELRDRENPGTTHTVTPIGDAAGAGVAALPDEVLKRHRVKALIK
jgi:hypothetical protein